VLRRKGSIEVGINHRHPGVAAVEDQGVGQEVEEGQEVERAAQEGRGARGGQEVEKGRRADTDLPPLSHPGVQLAMMTETRKTISDPMDIAFQNMFFLILVENGISGAGKSYFAARVVSRRDFDKF